MVRLILAPGLAEFLVRAKKATWAGDSEEVRSQRPGFKEFLYKQGPLEYRDSYSGYEFIQGQEVVRVEGKPVWGMSYSGGIIKKISDKEVKSTFNFLKQALGNVEIERPFRGPERFSGEGFVHKGCVYTNESRGNLENFHGTERILYKYQDNNVYELNYVGGLIVPKGAIFNKVSV